MNLHGAELGLLDKELEGFKDQIGAEPHVLGGTNVEGGLKGVSELSANSRV